MTDAPDVLVRLEKELKRLDEQATREPGPVYPPPSRELAYYLLVGVSAHGVEVKEPTQEERQTFSLGRGANGKRDRLIQLAEGRRVAFVANWMQDRSGSYFLSYASFYVRREGKWEKIAFGEIASSE